MIGADELIGRVGGLDRAELLRWIDNRWIVPDEHGGAWLFREVDIARVELILDIRRDFAIDDEAMPLVLGLVDQVYSLRRQLRRLCDALEAQPTDIRDAIRRALPPAESI
jgi:chaperone modulatory protein CbpM